MLFFWEFFTAEDPLTDTLMVRPFVAGIAAAAIVIALISYKFTPKKSTFIPSLIMYAVLSTACGALILTTGGTSSPFVALWMTLSVFAGIFGLYGLLPLLLCMATYAIIHISDGTLDQASIAVLLFGGTLPLGISYLIWHSKTVEDSNDKQAYQALASELNQVASKSEVVINAIADGVIALDNKGIVQLINPAAQKLIGWGKQDAMQLGYRAILKLTDKNNVELDATNDPIIKVLATNQRIATSDLTLVTNSGKKLSVSVVVSPIGQMGSGVIVVFRDITKEKDEEREQAEFISTASHEMRTPVASIEGYLGLALNPATAQIDAKAREFIMKAHESSQHLGRLFQDLLDVSKAADGRLSNNPKVTDVVEFTHNITLGLILNAEKKGLKLHFKPQTDANDNFQSNRTLNPVFYANVDNDHLREVLSNLIENAIKYTLHGNVTVDVNGDDDHVTISIADTGIGIPAEDMSHLFQKFYRVDNSDTREIGGTGLGLYLSRRLVEALNGRIWVESQYKQGSTFYVELPRIPHTEAMRLLEEAAETPIVETAAVPSAVQPVTADVVLPSQQAPATQAQAAPIPIVTPPQPTAQSPAPYVRPGAERVVIPPRM